MDSNSKKKFWELKPYWCQPWSIISFGIFSIAFSWILFNNFIITTIIGIFIIIWWAVFLILAPNLHNDLYNKK